MDINLSGMFTALILFGATIVLVVWGVTSFFTDDAIKSDKPIVPEIELIIKDNKVDTVYVYRLP